MSEPLNAEERAKAEAATAGPWSIAPRTDGNVELTTADGDVFGQMFGEDGDPMCWPVTANAAHIARMDPQTTLRLLDERDALAAEAEVNKAFYDLTVTQRDHAWVESARHKSGRDALAKEVERLHVALVGVEKVVQGTRVSEQEDIADLCRVDVIVAEALKPSK